MRFGPFAPFHGHLQVWTSQEMADKARSNERRSHVYYLPFYFQAVKGTTAEESGIRCIAYLISNTIGAIIVGAIVTVVGYYTPFIYFGTALFTIGSGLIYTLQVNSPAGRWIGYQILAGFGAGGAVQLPFIATQVVLPAKDMPTGNSLAVFFNSLGGAIAISIAQNIFANTLVKELPKVGLGDLSGLILASVSVGVICCCLYSVLYV